MVIGASDVSSSSFVVSYKRDRPWTWSSSGGSSTDMGDPCSCSECASSDDDPPSVNQLTSIENGSAKNLTINIPIDNGSSTVLDMHVVDHQESRKLKDDSKVHHILDDAMFSTRKRFNKHHRHMLHENESALFHHNVRQNLRHIISRHKGEHGHGAARHRHHNKKRSEKEKEDKEGTRKNVSFAKATEEPEITVTKPKASPVDNTDNESEDQGITFTVSKDRKDSSDNDFIVNMDDYSPQTTITRTAAETTLPWKNFANRNNPVSSYQSMLALANGDEPCRGEAPTWLSDSDANQLTVVPISMLRNDLKCNMSESAINEKVTVIHFRRQNRAEDGSKLASAISAPQLLDSTSSTRDHQSKPDILNCSSPNEEFLRTKKIDDFHESAPSAHDLVDSTTDLRPSSQVIRKGSPEDKLDFNGSVNGWSSHSHTSGTDDCYLPATWRTCDDNSSDHADRGVPECGRSEGGQSGTHLVHLHSSSDDHAADFLVHEDEANLPPPWKNQSDSSEEGAQRSAVMFEIGDPSESTSVRSLPWEHPHHHQDNPLKAASAADLRLRLAEDASMDEIDQSSMKCLSDHDADCIPPPWRSVNVSEGSVPVRSPSASHELDSLFPQASHNSLRLSEAESRHSEQFRGHHHVIDIAPREIEHTTSSPALSSMVGTDSEPIDLVSRVEMWLLSTKLDQQDPVPEDLYVDGSNELEGEADFVDVADYEDTIL